MFMFICKTMMIQSDTWIWTHSGQEATFTVWSSFLGEPIDPENSETCLAMGYDLLMDSYFWDDRNCSKLHLPLCQYLPGNTRGNLNPNWSNGNELNL